MTTLIESNTNAARRQQAEFAWNEMLREALRRGFHGTVSLEVNVQDGTIQHLRRRVERIEK